MAACKRPTNQRVLVCFWAVMARDICADLSKNIHQIKVFQFLYPAQLYGQ